MPLLGPSLSICYKSYTYTRTRSLDPAATCCDSNRAARLSTARFRVVAAVSPGHQSGGRLAFLRVPGQPHDARSQSSVGRPTLHENWKEKELVKALKQKASFDLLLTPLPRAIFENESSPKNTFLEAACLNPNTQGIPYCLGRGKKREKDCLAVPTQPGDEGVRAKANNVASSSVIYHTKSESDRCRLGAVCEPPPHLAIPQGRREEKKGGRVRGEKKKKERKKERSWAGKRASRNKRASSANVDGDPDRSSAPQQQTRRAAFANRSNRAFHPRLCDRQSRGCITARRTALRGERLYPKWCVSGDGPVLLALRVHSDDLPVSLIRRFARAPAATNCAPALSSRAGNARRLFCLRCDTDGGRVKRRIDDSAGGIYPWMIKEEGNFRDEKSPPARLMLPR
ncbi:hypothetical protein MTO96_023503 [Rhipicephalus appendiculatus]